MMPPDDCRSAVQTALSELGQTYAFYAAEGWKPKHGIPPFGVDAVAFSAGCGKHAHYVAGYFRGYGVPVVFVTDEHGSQDRAFASQTGALVVFGAEEFSRWLRSNPDYLRTAVRKGGV